MDNVALGVGIFVSLFAVVNLGRFLFLLILALLWSFFRHCVALGCILRG